MFKKLLALAVASLAITSYAAEQTVSVENFTIGLGFSYRNFHSITLKGASMAPLNGFVLTDPANGIDADSVQTDPSKYGNDLLPGGVYLPVRAWRVQADGFNANGNGDLGFQESLAPVLSAALPLYQNESLTLRAVANFQFYDFDTALNARGNGTASYWEHFIANGNFVQLDQPDMVIQTIEMARNIGKTKFDMQMYVIDLGVQGAYNVYDNLNITLAAGPSLSLADMESSSGGLKSNGHDWIFGIYASIGAEYWFNEKYGLSFDFRYDEAFKHADTKYADLNLDSWSGMLKFLVQF